MAAAASTASHWVALVPVKRLEFAKTRLERPDRADVALAMAEDTVAAAARCALVVAVLVITDDERARRRLEGLADVLVIADEPDRGLNPALRHGSDTARLRWPGCGVLALAADLPALRSDEIERVLRATAGRERCLVADAAGVGTVLLTAAPGRQLEPRFGRDSRAAHLATGAVDLTDAVGGQTPGLRRDVDTLGDLTEALALGTGPATTSMPARRARQATVRSWTGRLGEGDVITDDGEVLHVGPGSRLLGSLRELRPGQRVVLTPDGDVGLVSEEA